MCVGQPSLLDSSLDSFGRDQLQNFQERRGRAGELPHFENLLDLLSAPVLPGHSPNLLCTHLLRMSSDWLASLRMSLARSARRGLVLVCSNSRLIPRYQASIAG